MLLQRQFSYATYEMIYIWLVETTQFGGEDHQLLKPNLTEAGFDKISNSLRNRHSVPIFRAYGASETDMGEVRSTEVPILRYGRDALAILSSRNAAAERTGLP